MKKVMGILLAAVLLLCVSGCRGDDAKLYFPDNSSLKLSASKDEIIKAQNLELDEETSNIISQDRYLPKDDTPVEISGIKFDRAYYFNRDGSFDGVIYSAWDMDSEKAQASLDSLKKYSDKIYGQSEVLDEVYEQPNGSETKEKRMSGYRWGFSNEQGNDYEVVAYISTSYDGTQKVGLQVGLNSEE